MSGIFIRLYWLLLLTMIVSGIFIIWVIASEPGSKWAVDRILEKTEKTITLSNYSGTIITGIKTDELQYSNDALKINIKNLTARYSLRALIIKKLSFSALSADAINIYTQSKTKDSNQPITLPEFSSPVDISIKSLKVKSLNINFNKKLIALKDINTGVKFTKDLLSLEGFETAISTTTIQTDATLRFSSPFPVSANGNIILNKIVQFSDLNLNGTIHNYSLDTKVESLLENTPYFEGKLTATGDPGGLKITTSEFEMLDGKVAGMGDFIWKGGLRSTIDFTADKIKTEKYNKQFPGTLNLSGTYKLENRKNLVALQADGKIRNYPLTSKSNFSILDKIVHISDASVTIDENIFIAKGDIYPGNIGVLNVSLQGHKLQALHPDLKGDTYIHGKMNGALLKPVFDLQLSGKNLAYKNHTLTNYHAEFSPGTFRDHYFFDVKGKSGVIAAQAFNEMNLEGSFSSVRQKGKFDIKDTQYLESIVGSFEGSYNKNTAQWEGLIKTLDLSEKHFSKFSIKQPAQLEISKKTQTLSSLCLYQNVEKLCVKGSLSLNGKSQLYVQLDKFPIKRLKVFIPDTELLNEKLHGSSSIVGENGNWQANTQIGFGVSNNIDSDIRFDTNSKTLDGSISARFTKFEWLNIYTDKIIAPKGKLSVDLDLKGKTSSPTISAKVNLSEGFGRLPELGTELSNISIKANIDDNKNISLNSSLDSGNGNLTIKGKLAFNQLPIWNADLKVQGADLEAINIPVVNAFISPQLRIKGDNKGINISGSITVPKATILLGDLSSIATYPSNDEIIVGVTKEAKETAFPFDADIKIKMGEEVSVNGFGLNSRLSGELSLLQENGKPASADGSIQLVEGHYKAYGQKLDIEKGDIYFNGPLKTPGFNLVASRKIEADNVTAGLKISGTLDNPESKVFSDPALPETDALAYLLTGRGLSGLGENDSSMLLNAAARLGLKSSKNTFDKLRRKAGLDTFAIEAGQDISESALILGKFLTPELYIQYATKLFTESETFSLRYRLSNKLLLEAESDEENQSMDLIYQLER